MKKFWDELYQLEKNNANEKLLIHLERKIEKITNIKRKKLEKLSGKLDIKEVVSDRFAEHLNSDKVTLEETHNHPSLEKPSNAATVLDCRYEGKFVNAKVINLSKDHLSKDEISFLSKGLIKMLIRGELETCCRKLRLMWNYCDEEREITINPFQKKVKS